ncbi:MAG: hypothetical protein Ta2G_19750 [Termitinemataceae bacterium]|nr:MAG: hypothetical protein Ta2G_19750 [Termitinemataceae bacterium]
MNNIMNNVLTTYKKIILLFLLAVSYPLLFISCSYRQLCEIPFDNDGQNINLYARSAASKDGNFFFNGIEFTYELENKIEVPPGRNLTIKYSVTEGNEGEEHSKLILKTDNGTNAILPLNLDFIDKRTHDYFSYSIPLNTGSLRSITLNSDKKNKTKTQHISVKSFQITESFLGFIAGDENTDLSDEELNFTATPFVYSEGLNHYSKKPKSITLDPQEKFRINAPLELHIFGLKDSSLLKSNRQEFFINVSSANKDLFIPSSVLGKNPYPFILEGDADTFMVTNAALNNGLPIKADPGFILYYPKNTWRNSEYEYFSWDIFPSILIFDTKDYDVQDKLLKRLAFFAEKKGFRGRIAFDDEIKDLHGWNAHDYGAQMLSDFFNAADKINFNLNDMEKDLCNILLSAGIIKTISPQDTKSGEKYASGEGAIISFSRESQDYQRRMLLTHEAFHGIYFIDEDFRKFTAERWANLDKVSKRFLLSFFDYQQYDIRDPVLVLNEFMAHCLQLSPDAVREYFGETKPKVLEKHEWRYKDLPPKDEASSSWPHLASAFYRESSAFSGYVESRWGIKAGRVWRVIEQ